MILPLGDGKKVIAYMDKSRITLRVDNDGATGAVLLHPNAAKSLAEFLAAAAVVAADNSKS